MAKPNNNNPFFTSEMELVRREFQPLVDDTIETIKHVARQGWGFLSQTSQTEGLVRYANSELQNLHNLLDQAQDEKLFYAPHDELRFVEGYSPDLRVVQASRRWANRRRPPRSQNRSSAIASRAFSRSTGWVSVYLNSYADTFTGSNPLEVSISLAGNVTTGGGADVKAPTNDWPVSSITSEELASAYAETYAQRLALTGLVAHCMMAFESKFHKWSPDMKEIRELCSVWWGANNSAPLPGPAFWTISSNIFLQNHLIN